MVPPQRKRTLLQEQMSFRFKEMIRSQAALGEEEQSSGCSDVCFFCQRRVYVMERLSAEGLFFHRSCFHCSRCGATLRLAAYGFDQQSGKFYCLQHYNSGLGAPAARRRPTTSDGATSHRTSTASLQASVSSAGSLTSAERHRRSSAVSVMAATPERMELENCSEVEVGVELLEEVSEETLNQFNLSLDEIKERCSSESEMEEEEDEEDGQRRRVTSERARASWREALQLHLSNGPEEEEDEEEDDDEEEDGEMEEEEEQSSEVETSDEGEYSPRDMERRSGMWLLLEEETEEELPLISQGAASTAGSDITHCDTPTEPDSTSSPLPRKTSSTYPSETPPLFNTPSTASFVTLPDSSQDEHRDTAPPTQSTPVVVMETGGRKHAAWQDPGGRGSFEDIHPELQQKKHLHLQGGGGVEPDEEKVGQAQKDFGPDGVKKRRRYRGARSLPPRLLLPSLQSGGGALLLHLKGLRDAPPPGQVRTEAGGASALWRTVFSGNRKEKKKWGKTLPPGAERTRKDAANEKRDVTGSLTEGSDLDSSTLLHRCSLRPKHNLRLELFDITSQIQRVTIKEEEPNQEPAYVPHALAFKRAYAVKKPRPKERVPIQDSDGQSSCPTKVVGVLVQAKELSSLSVKETLFQRGREYEDEDLDAKITRRVQRAARRKAKQEQLKRLHKAQMIQRQLEQVEEKQRQLEERGVLVEKALRGEADYWGESNDGKDIELHLGGLGRLDNPGLMQQWFQLVQQKNSLVRYESELVIFARELELEDRQSRLQQELRERMAVDDHLKEEWQLVEERLILEEMLEVVEQRDSLVSLLEEQRLQERGEDHDVEEVMMTRWS